MWWRRAEPALDRETVDGIIRKLMDIDLLDLLVVHFGLSDDEDAEEDDDS